MRTPEPVLKIVIGQTSPPFFYWPIKFFFANVVVSYVLSILTNNVSQVDRVWTFLPTIYTAYFALLPLWPNYPPTYLFPYTPTEITDGNVERYSPRALLMLGLVFIWMCRLSYNTWRRGLFSLNEEDYRWVVLRKQIPSWLFQLINLVFISFIQHIILFLLGLPTQMAAFQQPEHLSTSDYVLAVLAIMDIAMEFTADNQQYSFQTYKHKGIQETNEWPGANIQWTPRDAKRGFVTRGLWAWSRHPNFFCEQAFWAIITLFPILAPEAPQLSVNPISSPTSLWPLAPAIVLCILFFSSTLFTESITSSKYPEYKLYQKRVAMFVPFLTPVRGALIRLIKGVDRAKEIDRKLFSTAEPEKEN